MKATKKLFFTALAIAALTACAWAQDSSSSAPARTEKHKSAAAAPAQPAVTAADVQALKDALAAQQQQIQQLTQQLQQNQQNWQKAQAAAADAANKAAAIQADTGQGSDSVRAASKEDVNRIAAPGTHSSVGPAAPATAESAAVFHPPSASTTGVPPVQDLQRTPPINIVRAENPLSIKIGGAEFTPGGFVDLTGIFRSKDVGSGLGTNFTILPYNNTLPLGGLSEFRFTGQGSRLSLKVEAKPSKWTDVIGYVESDFNGFEPANSNISTKSDTFRLRLAFLQVRSGKWELVAGQTWSFLTPNREGLSPFPENIFTALRLDSSYLAGLVYDRQPGIRVVYHAADWWSFGVAVENPQQFVPTSVIFPTDSSSSTFFSSQFDNGSSNTSSATAAGNPTVPNLHPDIIAKTAFDWRLKGKLFHVDAGAVARSFKVYNNLVKPADTNTITGGGGGVNLNFEALKNFHLIGNSFYGDGVGRYIGGLGPDVIVKPGGTLSGIHAGSGVAGFEWQTTPRLVIDGYYSGAYFGRNYAGTTKALGTACGATSYCVGFGFPGSANTNNRDYQEATVGFVPTIWSSPNYGKLQFISQFSYVVRSPWFVPTGSPKNAHILISYVNLRYIIP